jgi:hypothetical protein
MKSVLDYINEQRIDENMLLLEAIDAEIITESFQCKALKNLQKEIFKTKQDAEGKGSYRHYQLFKDIFRHEWYQWDKITNDDVTSYTAEESDKAKKILRKVIKGDDSTKMGIIYKDNKPAYVVMSYTLKDIMGDTPWYNRRGYSQDVPQYVKLGYIDGNAVDIIDLSNYSTGQIKRERDAAKRGIVEYDNPEYLRKIAEDNIRRYKDIISKKRAEAIADEDETVMNLNALVSRVLQIVNKFSENLAKYADKSYKVEQLVKGLYSERKYTQGNRYNKYQGYWSGRNGLLVLLPKYIDKLKDMHDVKCDGKTGYYGDHNSSKGESLLKEIEALRKEIADQIAYVEKQIEEIGI